MTRSRRPPRAAPSAFPAAPAAPVATFHDAAAVVQITDAGVKAIVTAAVEHGLAGEPWDPDVLHPEIMKIVAHALRRSEHWWADRTSEET
jgi:hypothetical protein